VAQEIKLPVRHLADARRLLANRQLQFAHDLVDQRSTRSPASKLSAPLGRNVQVSAEFAAAAGQDCRLVPLGRYSLRGVREARAIYELE